jgi:Aldo/keto reductase family
LDEIAKETGKTVPQLAINWLLQRPTVSSVIVGARDERQLRDDLGAVGWTLTPEQIARLDAASAVTSPYQYFPYYRQEGVNPPVVQAARPEPPARLNELQSSHRRWRAKPCQLEPHPKCSATPNAMRQTSVSKTCCRLRQTASRLQSIQGCHGVRTAPAEAR